MARIGDGGDLLKCSFCGKSQKQVKKLIAGPGVYICDECIDLCNEIIEEELAEPTEFKWDSLPKPREILYLRSKLNELYAKHTGKSIEQIERDMDRDRFMSAEEAKEYGIIDEVLTMIKRGSERAVEVVSSLPGEFSSSLSGR